MSEIITLTVQRYERGPGKHQTIVESPYAEALAVIDGLACATDNATYRGVRFGRNLQSDLVVYLWLDTQSAQFEKINRDGQGPYDFEKSYLDSILAAAAKIESIIARAVPAGPDYPCAAHRDGCGARVKRKGEYCRSCQHDER